MEPRDANVVESGHVVAHQLGRARGFFGDRKVRRAGGDNQNRSFTFRDILLGERDDARVLVKRGCRHDARGRRRTRRASRA